MAVANLSLQAQLNNKMKAVIIDSVSSVLEKNYVFPDVAKQMGAFIKSRHTSKQYDTISNERVFAETLTSDLFSVAHDKHVNLTYSSEVILPQSGDPMRLSPEEEKQYAAWLLSENYGINKVDVLPGNIGYIDFKWFCGPEYAGDTYPALMNYINHTDALIIDLRNSNGAMSTEVLPFICSYFFEKSTHLNDFYWRQGDRYEQTWTHAVVPGKKYLKPVYILISGKTFSGAEELAYDLKNLKRATLIGEPTGGGANGGGSIRVTDHYSIFVPAGRAISPITKTNWEGVGVEPDTLIRPNRALYKAQVIALQQFINNEKDTARKQYLTNILAQTEQQKPQFKTTVFTLNGFGNAKEVYVAGSFNSWSPKSDQLKKEGNKWVAEVETQPGRNTYKFIIDGRWILDPANTQIEKDGDYTNSLVVVD